jgi:hypothetical protein
MALYFNKKQNIILGLAGPVDICPWTFFAVHSVDGHYLCPWTSYMSMEFCVRKIVHRQIIIVHGQEIIVRKCD